MEIEKEIERFLRENLAQYTFYPVYTPVAVMKKKFPNIRIVSVKAWTRGEGVYRDSRYTEYLQMNKPIPGIEVKKIILSHLKDSSNNQYSSRHGHCNNYFYTRILYQIADEQPDDYFYAECTWDVPYVPSYIQIIRAIKSDLQHSDVHDHYEGNGFICRYYCLNLKSNIIRFYPENAKEEEELEQYIRTAPSFDDAVERAREIVRMWQKSEKCKSIKVL